MTFESKFNFIPKLYVFRKQKYFESQIKATLILSANPMIRCLSFLIDILV